MIKDGKFYKKKEGMKRMSKKILVTGCNGQLGRAINKEYAGSDVTFINTDVVEGEGVTALDITKIEQVLSLVRAEQPEVIINCAAQMLMHVRSSGMQPIVSMLWVQET